METVCLGTVGDPYVGKTLLCVSYTANFVYKEYCPTVLNCYWTTAVVDGQVVDIRIWDNSSSDDHKLLRPLSYPQTDVFLLCFSLKNRTSFENIERKWLPEVQNQVKDVTFLLVGCKRDKCVNEESVDVVTTDEGEELAHRLGAIGYAETSALEQSGFTSCFNKAIEAALEKQKSKSES